MCDKMDTTKQTTVHTTYRPPERPASITEEESTNDGDNVADGPSIANAVSAESTPARIEAAAMAEAIDLPASLFLAIEREVAGRELTTDGAVVKAVEEPMDMAAANRKADFMVLLQQR